jgi:UDPglucose 6-dehydrogenase
MTTVSFVGLGVVGLTTQIFFASRGIMTIGVDADKQKLKNLQAGKLPFHEPRLQELFDAAKEKIEFSDNIQYAIEASDLIFITVGTPSTLEGSIDLSQIAEASTQIGKALQRKSGYATVVVKSTVVPTTTSHVIRKILEEESNKVVGRDFGLVVNPEFLREGSGVNDTFKPNLLVIGSEERTADNRAAKELEMLWLVFFHGHAPDILKTNWVTAELIKYSNNTFLATKVSFINSIANICQELPGSDVELVAHAIGLDPRIGPLFLKAGPGYGGSCFPKDVKALINLSKFVGYESQLLTAVDKVNENQPLRILELVKNALSTLEGKAIAILGIAFKKDTDDIREAASVKIIRHLIDNRAAVKASDPMALTNLKKIFGDEVIYSNNRFETLADADCCIILTEWDEYKSMKPEDFIKYMKRPCIIDARRIFDPKKFLGRTEYFAIGLNPEMPNNHCPLVELRYAES